MSREIKFRAWNLEYGMLKIIGYATSINLSGFFEKVETIHTVMQFTGLVDKNDVEIYEGDIIRTPQDEVGIVKWQEGIAGFSIDYSMSKTLGKNFYGIDSHKFIEVIGNIYENPELISPTKDIR